MDTLIGLWNLLWTVIKGFFATPGLMELLLLALGIKLFRTAVQ